MNRTTRTLPLPSYETHGKYYLLLFILWPFLAFITALLNYDQKDARRVVYFFLIYYGLTFVIGDLGVDAERYAINLQITAEQPFSEIWRIIGGLYTDTTVDIVEPLVTFIVSRFTTSHNILFGVWAAIFGFFYLRSINLLHDQYQQYPNWNSQIFLIFFFMVIPITTISGVRMPLAAWVFFFGAYHAILYRKPVFLLVALSASLVHWSFITANALLLIYYFAGNRNIIYLPLLALSFIRPGLVAPLFQSLAMFSGGEIQNRYEDYSSDAYISGVQESYEGASWFLSLSNDLVFWFMIGAIALIIIFGGKHMKAKPDRNLFSFLLLFLAFVNFGKVIPTFGGRFQLLFLMFASVYIFRFFLHLPNKKLNFITYAGLFPMALYIAVIMRVGMISINVWLFSPGLGVPWLAPARALSDLFF